MIVPQFWAEARVHQAPGRGRPQLTVRRFGWSDVSEAAAQAMAESRAREAFDRILRGEKLDRREPRVPYNGASGVPIREEILARHGDVVITRNVYGAHCLNTPDVLFADIDFNEPVSGRFVLHVMLVHLVAAASLGVALASFKVALVAAFLGLVLAYPAAVIWRALWFRLSGGVERRRRSALQRYARRHPGCRLRIYRTPRGFRVMMLHRVFEPASAEVSACFERLGVDRLYARMCRNQRCFRARLTAKPWRVGLPDHIKPRPGTWPVNPSRIEDRQAWVSQYERVAAGYAACAFVEEIGDGTIDAKAAAVRDLHDRLSQALSGRDLG